MLSPSRRAHTEACAAAPAARTGGLLPLRLTGVHYQAGGKSLLRDITLEVGDAGPTCILGPNGAGKTLLLRICHGLTLPTSGVVRWGTVEAEVAARKQAMVFQRPVLLRRSLAGNVEHALQVRGQTRRERSRRAAEALERVGLTGLARLPARVLSGGEQQRAALARAWALEPEALLLDEPTANLDPSATQAIERTILDMHAAGVAILMTTHDLGQARRLAKRILFLHGGRILEDAPAELFFAGPATQQAAAFVRGDLAR